MTMVLFRRKIEKNNLFFFGGALEEMNKHAAFVFVFFQKAFLRFETHNPAIFELPHAPSPPTLLDRSVQDLAQKAKPLLPAMNLEPGRTKVSVGQPHPDVDHGWRFGSMFPFANRVFKVPSIFDPKPCKKRPALSDRL